jgi:hypothetical protein
MLCCVDMLRACVCVRVIATVVSDWSVCEWSVCAVDGGGAERRMCVVVVRNLVWINNHEVETSHKYRNTVFSSIQHRCFDAVRRWGTIIYTCGVRARAYIVCARVPCLHECPQFFLVINRHEFSVLSLCFFVGLLYHQRTGSRGGSATGEGRGLGKQRHMVQVDGGGADRRARANVRFSVVVRNLVWMNNQEVGDLS